ncbi:MAG: DNA mismatch repair protein MutS [Betaproteobacteria bacterium]|nr:DNA mismatch repair protein MutS [Betaproteobacteria bacterium]
MSQRKQKPPTDESEADVFREYVSDVTPLRDPGKAVLERVRPRPVPTQRLRDERAALRDSLHAGVAWDAGFETGEELCFLRAGIGQQVLRKLRRGHWVVQDELDLHGLTSLEARPILVEFLNDCMRRGLRCVRVIHGKGLRSKNREPVLKQKVASWLASRDEILAFCQARHTEGGSGAAVVLLQGERRKSKGERIT